MILYDRLTNSEQDVDFVQSGRYQALKPITINGHTDIDAQEVIYSDGKRTCDLNSQSLSFQLSPESPLQSLFEDAILTLSEMRTQGSNDLPSPLLPANLITEDSELSALEKRLIEVLEKGHLHHISQRPRIDLKYDETVVEVSRARRMTNKTLSHLGSHSECWQRRTLTGVIPRKVLTRYSDDDYEIYENRVYASLLDKLEIHLKWRLKRLVVLTESMDDALRFQDSEAVHYRLSNKICSLWGEVFDPEKTTTQLLSSKRNT